MARKLIPTDITGSVRAPFTKAALENMQSELIEVPSSLVKSMIGTYTTNDVVIMEGFTIVLTNSNNTATWTAGAVYYNGEVYQVAAGNLTKTGGQIFLYSIMDTIVSAEFSDGIIYDWIENKTITITAGLTGGGLANYGEATVKTLISIQNGVSNAITFSSSYTQVALPTYYRKDIFGNVHLRGTVLSPASVLGAIFMTLPTGYRPAYDKAFTVAPQGGASQAVYIIRVLSTGNVEVSDIDGSNIANSVRFSLDGVSFNVYE